MEGSGKTLEGSRLLSTAEQTLGILLQALLERLLKADASPDYRVCLASLHAPQDT